MFFFGKRKIITAVCFFVFMAVCGWFWRKRETVSFVSQPLSTAEAPFQYGTSQISLLARYGGATIGQIINHWKEVDTLRHENANLKAEQAAYSEILAENIRLKGMLNFKQTYTQYSMLGAKVIAKDYHLDTPECVASAINEYRGQNDWLRHFLDDCCDVDAAFSEKSGELYTAYRAYCQQMNEYTRSTTDFYGALEKAGFDRRKRKAGYFIYGLKLKVTDFL